MTLREVKAASCLTCPVASAGQACIGNTEHSSWSETPQTRGDSGDDSPGGRRTIGRSVSSGARHRNPLPAAMSYPMGSRLVQASI